MGLGGDLIECHHFILCTWRLGMLGPKKTYLKCKPYVV
jgi:hypothetical protein